MNEEAIKTKADKDKEVKKWTTFLQKPNRPIPKSKDQVQHEPYRVKIVKQPKPLCDPNRVRTPPPIQAVPTDAPKEIEPTAVSEQETHVESEVSVEVESDPLADSEVPDLEVCDAAEITASEEQQQIVENAETAPDAAAVADDAAIENESETNETIAPAPEIRASAEDTPLEKQLLDVQNQLAALSSLPSTIQTMLESVSRQLNEILPAFKLRTSIDISGSINEDSTLQLTEKIDFQKETNTELHVETSEISGDTITTEITDSESQVKESGEVSVEVCTSVANANEAESVSEVKSTDRPKLSIDEIARETEEQIVKMKTERVFQMQEEDWNRNKVCILLTFFKWNSLDFYG